MSQSVQLRYPPLDAALQGSAQELAAPDLPPLERWVALDVEARRRQARSTGRACLSPVAEWQVASNQEDADENEGKCASVEPSEQSDKAGPGGHAEAKCWRDPVAAACKLNDKRSERHERHRKAARPQPKRLGNRQPIRSRIERHGLDQALVHDLPPHIASENDRSDPVSNSSADRQNPTSEADLASCRSARRQRRARERVIGQLRATPPGRPCAGHRAAHASSCALSNDGYTTHRRNGAIAAM